MLKRYQELPLGGVVVGGATPQLVKTGSWRSGERPVYHEKSCIHCLLCWVHCPEATILIEHGQMRGFDYEHCKGCGICAEHCPTGAIEMLKEIAPAPQSSQGAGGKAGGL